MSAGNRIPLQEAVELAAEVSARLTPLVARSKCVGSVRRRKSMVGDIEFVVEPIMNGDLFSDVATPILEPIRDLLHELGTWKKGGARMMQITDLLGRPGLKLEINLVHPPAAWGSLVAIRTGPAELGTYVVTACRRFGFRHDSGYAQRLDTGERVPTDTEEQFFQLAEVPCVPPREREELATRLWAGLNQGTRREVSRG